MQPRIEQSPKRELIGLKLSMSLAEMKTAELWRRFMPRRREIRNAIGSELYSMQVYDRLYFDHFSPHNRFEKWATVEVSGFDAVPGDMETFILSGGLYAVFVHKGSNTDTSTFEYIFGDWLPKSEYVLDNRPHFEILGEKYKNGDPNSEEEIWIPIKLK